MYRGAEKLGVNAIPYQGIQPLSLFGLFTSRKSSSPCTGEPRNAPETLGARFAQGRTKMWCKPFRRSGDTTPQSFRLVNKPKIQLPLHRGAEARPPLERCEPRTREPRFARSRRGAGLTQGNREAQRTLSPNNRIIFCKRLLLKLQFAI